jgi:hypothetical protein
VRRLAELIGWPFLRLPSASQHPELIGTTVELDELQPVELVTVTSSETSLVPVEKVMLLVPAPEVIVPFLIVQE